MLSAEFGSIRLSDITVSREERIRREVKEEDVQVLAESISRNGLVHPIVLTRQNVLVAGETRLRACTSLGWSHISFQYLDELSPTSALAVELEENVKRRDLDWKDQCDALRRFHELQQAVAKDEGQVWSIDSTAAAIGYAPRTVRHQLQVAAELAAGNERVAAAKEYSTARGIAIRQSERRASDELKSIGLLDETEDLSTSPERIINTSFLDWVETYNGQPFNLIHCDFPYGINADKMAQGASDSFGGYEDSPELYWSLVGALCQNKDKLLGSSGHILFWFSMRYYTETLAILREHFWVDPYPLLWHKSDNKGTLPDPQRGPRRVYEVAFLCSHGDRKIIQSVSNTFSGPRGEVTHMSEKSQDMLEFFFRMFIDDNSRVLDPTCGSGSALRAAITLGAESVLGLEINTEFAEEARRNLDE